MHRCVFKQGQDISQEFWERTEQGLEVIWPGESALFPFGEDRLWIPFLAVTPSPSVDISQTGLSLLLQLSKRPVFC